MPIGLEMWGEHRESAMLGNPEWYARPDTSASEWCLLVIETEQRGETTIVQGWEIGHANSHQILRREAAQTGDSDEEADILQDLVCELDSIRREHPILVTKREWTISVLRTRFLACGIDDASFRGFTHFSLNGLLSRFTLNPNETANWAQGSPNGGLPSQKRIEEIIDWCTEEYQKPIQRLWEALMRIGPLVPEDDLNGESL